MTASKRTAQIALAAVGSSLVIGILAIFPVGFAIMEFIQSVLVPMGLARRNPMWGERFEVVMVMGVVIPLLLLITWLTITHLHARRSPAPWLIWIVALVAVALLFAIFMLFVYGTEPGLRIRA